jgi:hypothetical protein
MGTKQEPPSRPHSRSPLFFVGKDSEGHWVVQDEDHLRGGIFVDRAEALRFAMFENGRRPQAVVMVPGILELDMNRLPHPASQPPVDINPARARRA